MIVSIPALLAACGGAAHTAQSPANDETTSAGDSDKKGTPASPPGETEAASKPSPCAGTEIGELTSVLAQSACEAKGWKPDAIPPNLSDSLEVKVSLDARKVVPGGKATVTVSYHNKGTKELPLYFVVDPEPRFELEVHTLKGARVDHPAGREPALPDAVAHAAPPDKLFAVVTLPPQGTATAVLPWQAVRHRWASKDAAKGAVPGHGYPQEAAGPIPRGKYVLRVITPMVNVSEGIDHEMSQPRLNIEVGTP